MKNHLVITVLLCTFLVLGSTNNCPSYNGNDLLQSGIFFYLYRQKCNYERATQWQPRVLILSTSELYGSILGALNCCNYFHHWRL